MPVYGKPWIPALPGLRATPREPWKRARRRRELAARTRRGRARRRSR